MSYATENILGSYEKSVAAATGGSSRSDVSAMQIAG